MGESKREVEKERERGRKGGGRGGARAREREREAVCTHCTSSILNTKCMSNFFEKNTLQDKNRYSL